MNNLRKLFFSAGVFLAFLIFLVPDVSAGPRPGNQQIPAIFIGERVVNIAYHLGVMPEVMVTRCDWPMVSRELATIRTLGCPKRVIVKNKKSVIDAALEMGIKRVIVEKNKHYNQPEPGVNPAKIIPVLKKAGLKVEVVDFDNGIEPAITRLGLLLQRREQAEKVKQDYLKALEKVTSRMANKKTSRDVVVLRGVLVGSRSTPFVQVAGVKGYTDHFFLTPLGCKNVGDRLKNTNTKSKKGFFQLPSMAKLLEAQPETIIMTGKSFAVQQALIKEINKNPAMLQIPAIKNQRIFSLPDYIDGSVIDYPRILSLWHKALSL
jgi:hypothetical protein